LKLEKSVKLDREVALDMAQKNLADAVREQEAHASRLAEAEKALVLGKQALVAARRDLKKFDKDSRQKIVRESTQLEAHLSTFLDGPFAAFKKLEVLLLPSQLVKPPSCELQSAETRTALTRALTRIGTMAVPPSPVEMEEDGDKHDADHENAGDGRAEQEDDAEEDDQEDNEEDPDETEQEDDMPLSKAGAPIVFQPP